MFKKFYSNSSISIQDHWGFEVTCLWYRKPKSTGLIDINAQRFDINQIPLYKTYNDQYDRFVKIISRYNKNV